MTVTESDIKISDIDIDADFEKFLRPLNKEEYDELEKSIVASDGAVDPLRAARIDGAITLLDGHTRKRICETHGLGCSVVIVEGVDTYEDALKWILENQSGRRNITPEEMSAIRGRLYDMQVNHRGGDQKEERENVAKELAESFGASESTILRDHKYFKARESLAEPIKRQLREGDVKLNKTDVQQLATLEPRDQQRALRSYKSGEVENVKSAIQEVTGGENGAAKSSSPPAVIMDRLEKAFDRVCWGLYDLGKIEPTAEPISGILDIICEGRAKVTKTAGKAALKDAIGKLVHELDKVEKFEEAGEFVEEIKRAAK